MKQIEDIERMKKAAEYRFLVKNLKPAGIGSIIFGLLAVISGALTISESPIEIIVLLIGIFLVYEGIVNISNPEPKGFKMLGIALVLVGVWNIIFTIIEMVATKSPGFPFWIMIGIFQILWGIQNFKLYDKYKDKRIIPPSKEVLKYLDDIIKEIKAQSFKKNEDIIEFQTTAGINTQQWKAKLLSNKAVFVDNFGKEIVFAGRGEVNITKTGQGITKKTLKINFSTSEKNMKGTMNSKSFERYENWKNSN